MILSLESPLVMIRVSHLCATVESRARWIAYKEERKELGVKGNEVCSGSGCLW